MNSANDTSTSDAASSVVKKKKKEKRSKEKKHKKNKKKKRKHRTSEDSESENCRNSKNSSSQKYKKRKTEGESVEVPGPSVPPELLAEQAKSRAPMTKEEWEKSQSVIRRVYDETTGRSRFVNVNMDQFFFLFLKTISAISYISD